jgi:serine/threonine-protein kinase
MSPHEPLLEQLADAVLTGAAVDWAAAESGAGAAVQPLVRDLKLLASVARLHRDVLPAAGPGVGDQWGHLQLVEHVGRGATGEVFRAWDTRLEREVALKLLPALAGPDDDVAQTLAFSIPRGDARSMIREGRLLAKVRHPNVVTIHGAEQYGDHVGLWMEFIKGHTLEQLLQQGVPFRSGEVVATGIELCRAVSAVHAAGLLHRDIKAQNIMRADDGRIVLMDFDAGRELDDASAPDVAGTPLYLAPELFRGDSAAVQSDVYSLGVVLYRLATGEYPVRGASVGELRAAHERGARVSVREARRDVPAGLARVIEQAIDPRPERRHQTTSALMASLVGLQHREARKPIFHGAGLVAASAAVALGVWAFQPEPPVDPSATAQTKPAEPAHASSVPSPPPPSPPAASPAPAASAPNGSDTPVASAPAAAPPLVAAVVRPRPRGVRPSVQVMPITNASGRSGDAWLSAALAEMLLREFRGSESFRWIPGVVALAKAQLGQALITESSQTIRPIVPADVVVTGEFFALGEPGQLRLVLKVDDLQSGNPALTVTETGTTDDLVGLVTRAGVSMRTALGAPALTPERAKALAASQPANASAARAYAEGLGKVASEWVESMEAAVAADPRFAPAYIALAEGRSVRREPEKVRLAMARAVEHSADIPIEERMLIEIRSLVSTGVPTTGPPDEATRARQNARVEAREAIFRKLHERYPDTLLYGFETARAHYRTEQFQAGLATVDAINHLPGARDDLGLLQLEGRLARPVRAYDRADKAWDRASTIAENVGDRGTLAFIRHEQALLACDRHDRVTALKRAEEAAKMFAERRSHSQVFMVRTTAARIIFLQGGVTWAKSAYGQISAAALQAGDRELARAMAYNGARLLADHGELSEAWELLERVSREGRAEEFAYGGGASLGLGGLLYRRGAFALALEQFESALGTAIKRQDPYEESLVRPQMALLLLQMGDMARALVQADRGLATARERLYTPREHVALALVTRARVLDAAGDTDAARQAAAEAAAITDLMSPIGRADRAAYDVAMVRSRIALEAGKPDEARVLAQQAIDFARAGSRPDDEAAAEAAIALAYLAEGRGVDARLAIARLEARLKATEDRILRLSSSMAIARVRFAADSTPGGAALVKQQLNAMIQDASMAGADAIVLEARLVLGEIEVRSGDIAAGRVRLQALERDARAKGFLGIARKAAAAAGGN